jgi:Lipocalin-like domain
LTGVTHDEGSTSGAVALNSAPALLVFTKSKAHAGCSSISAEGPAQFCDGVATLAHIRLGSTPVIGPIFANACSWVFCRRSRPAQTGHFRKFVALPAAGQKGFTRQIHCSAFRLAGIRNILTSPQANILNDKIAPETSSPNPIRSKTYSTEERVNACNEGKIRAEYGDRLKVEDWGKATAEQRAALFKTFWAYAGTYTFNGSTIEHHVDTSWNATWTGTTVIRDVAQDGNHIVLTTRPQVRFSDGKMNVITLTWEKVK